MKSLTRQKKALLLAGKLATNIQILLDSNWLDFSKNMTNVKIKLTDYNNEIYQLLYKESFENVDWGELGFGSSDDTFTFLLKEDYYILILKEDTVYTIYLSKHRGGEMELEHIKTPEQLFDFIYLFTGKVL